MFTCQCDCYIAILVTCIIKLHACQQLVWTSLSKLLNTSYDQHIEDFLTHLQNSIRLIKIWKSLGTLGWSPTTGSDNDTCSFSRGETGVSVVEALAVAGLSAPYRIMCIVRVVCSIYSLLYRYSERGYMLDVCIHRYIYTAHAVLYWPVTIDIYTYVRDIFVDDHIFNNDFGTIMLEHSLSINDNLNK